MGLFLQIMHSLPLVGSFVSLICFSVYGVKVLGDGNRHQTTPLLQEGSWKDVTSLSYLFAGTIVFTVLEWLISLLKRIEEQFKSSSHMTSCGVMCASQKKANTVHGPRVALDAFHILLQYVNVTILGAVLNSAFTGASSTDLDHMMTATLFLTGFQISTILIGHSKVLYDIMTFLFQDLGNSVRDQGCCSNFKITATSAINLILFSSVLITVPFLAGFYGVRASNDALGLWGLETWLLGWYIAHFFVAQLLLLQVESGSTLIGDTVKALSQSCARFYHLGTLIAVGSVSTLFIVNLTFPDFFGRNPTTDGIKSANLVAFGAFVLVTIEATILSFADANTPVAIPLGSDAAEISDSRLWRGASEDPRGKYKTPNLRM